MKQIELIIETPGRALIDISEQLNNLLSSENIDQGIANIFLQHTSASLIINENADPTVLSDLETLISRLAPDGDPEYLHNYEGDDDMAAHVRAMLTSNSLMIPVRSGRLALGTWQGVFLWEHRYRPHRRKLLISVLN